MSKNQQVQIDKDLFFKCYLLLADDDFKDVDEEIYIKLLKSVQEPLKAKLDAIMRHDTYSRYKTAETEEEREQARQEYLEQVGMHKDFRWGKDFKG